MSIFKKNKPNGILYINKNESDGQPDLFLEALEDPSEFIGKKYVTFKVKVLKTRTQK